MTSRHHSYDAIVIGGGIFGAYAALHLKKRKLKVALIEKENRLFSGASVVNQARLHGGYHYPRSMATAMQTAEHYQRFLDEHKACINHTFDSYYAVDRYNSLVDAAQFERFAEAVGMPCAAVQEIPGVDFTRLERVYKTVEHGFDPYLIAEYYKERLRESGVDIYLHCHLRNAMISGGAWRLFAEMTDASAAERDIAFTAPIVVNATYAAINAINGIFSIPAIDVQHELAEICLLNAPRLARMAFTVMDGPFCSVMPFGLSGLVSLSSVTYTPHELSRLDVPNFQAQTPSSNLPSNQPSNVNKMLAQLRQYIDPNIPLAYQMSFFTVKTKLKASYIDDSRPTLIRKMRADPDFYCLFGGKINSIYECEKELAHA